MISKQQELYTNTSMERAIELTAWLRHEIDTMRLRIRAEQIELRQLELAMRKVQDILFDLQQEELFGD
jgi:hypothetical protein